MDIKLFRSNSKLPIKAHDSDAGFDLTVSAIKKRSLFKIHYKLGIAIDLPPNYYAEVFPRSSIHKLFLWLSNSTSIIDNGYIGEWQAVFYKIPFISKIYKIGDRCCQVVFKKMQDENIDFNIVDDLNNSDRGINGFGSTGK